MLTLTRLSPLVVLLAPAIAEAGTKEDAEHTRLAEEMRRLASRNAWRGVEAAYQKMLPLQRRDVTLTFDDHYIGAQAASNLGNINDTYRRLKRAVAVAEEVEQTRQAGNWLREIEGSYGQVELKVDPRYTGEATLSVVQMPFATDQRAAYDRAQAKVSRDGSYTGLLPVGKYTFGDSSFTVKPNSDEQRIVLGGSTAGSAGSGLAYAGPRIDLGGAFSRAGDPSTDAGEIAPAGFGGAGLRAGLGLEVGTHSGLGGLLEVGYHGISGAASTDPAAEMIDELGLSVPVAYGYSSGQTSVGLIYGWLAGTYHVPLGDFGMTAMLGPVFGLGSGSVQGAAGESSSYADRYSQLNGSIRAGGVSGGLSLTHSKASIGKLGVGLSALGGAQSDTARWYTWGQAALTITPARRDG